MLMQWKKLLWDKLHQAKHCTLTFLQLFQCRFAALQRVLCIVEIIVTYILLLVCFLLALTKQFDPKQQHLWSLCYFYHDQFQFHDIIWSVNVTPLALQRINILLPLIVATQFA